MNCTSCGAKLTKDYFHLGDYQDSNKKSFRLIFCKFCLLNKCKQLVDQQIGTT